MRNTDEQQLALECLRMAIGQYGVPADIALTDAERFFAFVTGEEDAAAKLAAVREAVSR